MWIWFGLAALALIGEALSGTFFLLLLALGLAAGGASALVGVDRHWQLVVAGAVALVGLGVLRMTGVLKQRALDASRCRDVNLDIGQSVQVSAWAADRTARIWYRGAHWHADLVADVPATPGTYTRFPPLKARVCCSPPHGARPHDRRNI
jgi:membrane protein implicated in regulation of membrane protease activity